MLTLIAALALQASAPKVKASLLVSDYAVRPGDSVRFALELVPEANWHTYWKNPGDAGLPTSVTWKLPTGWTATPLRWPAPQIIDSGGIVSYGYVGKTILFGEFSVPKGAPLKPYTLRAEASWMACNDVCVAEEKTFEITLGVGRNRLPTPANIDLYPVLSIGRLLGVKAKRERAGYSIMLPTQLSAEEAMDATETDIYFFSEAASTIAHDKAQTVHSESGRVTLRVVASEFETKPAKQLAGVIKIGGRHYQVLIPVDVK